MNCRIIHDNVNFYSFQVYRILHTESMQSKYSTSDFAVIFSSRKYAMLILFFKITVTIKTDPFIIILERFAEIFFRHQE